MIQVLLVEDDPMVAEFNRIYVNKVEGFRTAATARTGLEARQIIQQQAINLILLDIFMPGLNGMELLTGIRAAGLEIDVIFVTAACDMKTINKALKLGAVDYLIKPFEFDRLRQALEHYQASRLLIGEGQTINQKELDRFLKRSTGEASAAIQLPKGLDRSTLPKVWQVCRAEPDKARSCDEIAVQVGLSRVSVHKYLEYLVAVRLLRCEISYGGVGRPVHRYSLRPDPPADLLSRIGLS